MSTVNQLQTFSLLSNYLRIWGLHSLKADINHRIYISTINIIILLTVFSLFSTSLKNFWLIVLAFRSTWFINLSISQWRSHTLIWFVSSTCMLLKTLKTHDLFYVLKRRWNLPLHRSANPSWLYKHLDIRRCVI